MLGSAVGGGARFLIAGWMQGRFGQPFPIGTLAVNITGSFVLGFVLELAVAAAAIGPQAQLFLTTGLCGGYTTFSTFSAESVAMIRSGAWGRASGYIAVSVAASLVAVVSGAAFARMLLASRGRS